MTTRTRRRQEEPTRSSHAALHAAYDAAAQRAALLTMVTRGPSVTPDAHRKASDANRVAARAARNAGDEASAQGHERLAICHDAASAAVPRADGRPGAPPIRVPPTRRS